MGYKNLSQYIAALEKEGELVRIAAAVDPVYEIAEITDRVSKSPGGGKALLFENTGTPFPVLVNMLGSERRMAMALGVESLGELTSRIDSLLHEALAPRERMADKLRLLPLLTEVSQWMPHTSRRRGECQQVVLKGGDARLSMLPILKCWPYDGGRFVTLPLVNTLDPETGVRNVGMYRMQVTGEHTTGMHWHMHKTGQRHWEACRRLGRRMPVSVALGGDPAYTYAATAPMPDNMDEYLLAGFLRRRSVELVKCITNDLYVPSDCDFVIEGYVDPAEPKFSEGPFGDHTGFYSLEDDYPVFHVTAITHRRDAVYPATLVGIPPQEDAFIATATEKIFLAPIRLALQPEVRDMYMPPEGVAHNIALLSIDKSYPGQAFKVASSMWGAGQMMFNKVMLVAPAGIDLRDRGQVARLVRHADPGRDVLISRGVLDVLDHAVERMGEGGKMALDLTADRPECGVELPEKFACGQWIDSVDTSFAREWGAIVVRCAAAATVDPGRFIAGNPMQGIKYVVIIDTSTRMLTPSELLWFAAANTDPGRDIAISRGVMVVDARTKYPYREGYPLRVPNPVAGSPQTVALVDSRWAEYGLGEFLESPSLRYSTLAVGNGAQMG